MSVLDIISKLKKHGINMSVSPSGELDLFIKGDNILTDDLLLELKKHKREIILFLNDVKEKANDFNIKNVEKREYYPVSSAQKRMFLIQQINSESTSQNMPATFNVSGKLKTSDIEDIFKDLISHHESLKTSFRIINNEIVQLIHNELEFEVKEKYITFDEVENIKKENTVTFNLSKAPLLRATIFRIEDLDSILFIDMHHIISDGVTNNILINDFFNLLNKNSLKPLKIQYKDFAKWQSTAEYQQEIKKQENYWLKRFNVAPEELILPYDFSYNLQDSQGGAKVFFSLDQNETGIIKNIIQEKEITLFMSMLSIFNILLAKLSGQNDIVIGTPVITRDHVDFETVVGNFINTLAIRNKIPNEFSLNEFIEQVKINVINAFDNKEYQFEHLVEKVTDHRETTRNPLFNVMLNVLNQKDYDIEVSKIVSEDKYIHEQTTAPFDITFTVFDLNEQILINIEYKTNLFTPKTIERYISYFKNIINQLMDLNKFISQINLLGKKEKRKILYEFNCSKQTEYEKEGIYQLFENECKKYPDRIALILNDEYITFKKLHSLVANLSYIINSKTKVKEGVIGVKVERSAELVISMLAIFKSGFVYVPIDPELPKKRVSYIIKDTGMSLLIADRYHFTNDLEIESIHINKELAGKSSNYKNVAPLVNKYAYIIYTSGTTGNPKGVIVKQNSIINLILSQTNEFSFSKDERILQFSNSSFDASIEQILLPILNGLSLVLVEKEILFDPLRFKKYIIKNSISHLDTVPAYLKSVDVHGCKEIKRLIVGGEECDIALATQYFNEYKLYNLYGPTETTITSTKFLLEQIKKDQTKVPIGKPIENTQIYILKDDQIVPIGVYGELCITGDGISDGYLNDPELTNAKFVNILDNTKIVYKTGDIARWLPDGNIEFAGRIDDQVKIRGQRIEIKEIELAINKFQNVKKCLVVKREINNIEQLITYVQKIGKEFTLKDNKYYISTVEQCPSLEDSIEQLHASTWPIFLKKDIYLKKYWKRLYKEYSSFQFGILSSNGELVAAGNTIPIYWDKTKNNLPSSWSRALEMGLEPNNNANTLFTLVGVVSEKYRNVGLSYEIIKCMQNIAKTFNYERVLIPVRPALKSKFPLLDLKNYYKKLNDKGDIFDPWFRVHKKMGGEVVRFCENSQYIKATVEDWEKWTGETFSSSDIYIIKGGHTPLKINIDKNIGEYYDTAVWITHKAEGIFDRTNLNDIKEELMLSLPKYMIPDYFVGINKIPITTSGKIDRNRLPEPKIIEEKQNEALSYKERLLANIWAEVLGISQKEISSRKSFFELGGHSLSATVLIANIQKKFGVSISLRDIFENQKIKNQVELITRAKKEDYYSINRTNKKEFYTLSSAQKRLFIIHNMNPESITYNMTQEFRMNSDFKIQRIESIFKKIIKRHEVLRTGFELLNEEPVQKIYENVDFNVQYIDCKDLNRVNIDEIKKDFIKPFKLNSPPLIRGVVVKSENNENLVLLDMHHIICDGISQEILESEFINLYSGIELPELKLQYKDYSDWQNSDKQIKKAKLQESYWLNVLSGELPVLQLPTDYKRPLIQTFDGASVKFLLGEANTNGVRKIAVQQDMTLYMLLLAALKILLSKLSNQNDIIVGTPVAGRRHVDLENIVGNFVNTLAIRSYPDKNKTIKEYLSEIKSSTISAFVNQDYQFENLIEELSVERNAGRNPVFDIMFAWTIAEYVSAEFLPKADLIDHEKGEIKFDMVWNAIDKGSDILVILEYNTNLFAPQTIERIVKYYKRIIEQICIYPDGLISEIDILDEADKKELLYKINNTNRKFSDDKSLINIFEETVVKNQNRTAITLNDQNITYKQLNDSANRLSRYLYEKGIRKNHFVGVMQDRSLNQIISILGVLKSGAAYLPIEPEYPIQRIRNVLNDTQTSILLTDNKSLEDKSFTLLKGDNYAPVEICKSSVRKQIEDLDNHPIPNRSLVDYEKYNQHIGQAMVKNSIVLQCSRGCPYKCAYCHKIWPKGHITRSAEHIFNELMLYYEIGVRRFVIVDDIFNLDIKNSKRFFQLIVDNNLKLQLYFPNGLRGDILTKEYIDLMVAAGTVSFALALETTSKRLQKLIGKNLNVERFKENVEYISSKYPEVILELFTMHGFPGETTAEALDTLNFIKSIKWLHFPYVHILKIYPNTDMEKIALKNGISKDVINRSINLAYHELPETLPFEDEFTLIYQTEFLNNYFLLKERLLKVLPYQMKVLTEDELLQKYRSYLPVKIDTLQEFLEFVNINIEELEDYNFINEDYSYVNNLNEKIKKIFVPEEPANNDALKILLIDLSQFYSNDSDILYDVVEPPLGLMYISTYLKNKLGKQVECKIIKSRVDFDSNLELKRIIKEFEPNVIGTRTLSFYKDFFHKMISLIRLWGYEAPIIAGGPYATSNYDDLLNDTNIDMVCMGEGEVTFYEIVKEIIANNGILPNTESLLKIEGLAIKTDGIPNGVAQRKVIVVDEINLEDYDNENINISSSTEDIVYTIYTSGSSGVPKGVLINNRNVVNLIQSQKDEFKINSTEKICQFSSVCFDASVEQIWLAFFSGANLNLVSKESILNKDEFTRFLLRKNITHLHAVPSFLEGLNESKYYFNRVIAGGDVCRVGLAEKFNKEYDFYNEYGPTETTVTSIEMLVKKINKDYSSLPIGRPIGNTSIYILDEKLNLVPFGTIGDLYIGGEGVGIGYINKVELTNDSFIENPFVKNEKLYKTGDRVRLLNDTNIEFQGREDNQVKIRGFRIELGEIESCILKHQDVEKALVVAINDSFGEKILRAFLVLNNVKLKETLPQIKVLLSQSLPHYMIPSTYKQLEEIPLNQNGKVDRELFKISVHYENKNYVKPEGLIEETLAKVWGNILKIDSDKIGAEDNFFELGGHSLKLNILLSEIFKNFNIRIPANEIFIRPTIKDQAIYIEINNLSDNELIEEEGAEEIRI